MYDIRKRRGFQTVGELRSMLNHLPAHTRVTICGDFNCFFHEEQDNSFICLDCEDLNDHYEEAMESMLSRETPEERDRHLESLWKKLDDVLMNPETETIEAPFYIFSAGTNREEIWRWFDQHYSRGVAYLLHSGVPAYDPENTPLSQFIRQEVPYRLVEIFEIPPEKITPLVMQECVDLLESNSDGLFRYDRIEMLLLEVLKDHGLWKGDM